MKPSTMLMRALLVGMLTSQAHAQEQTPTKPVTSRERAAAIYQFHAELVPMMSHRNRDDISEVRKKAESGNVSYYMPMFFFHLFSTTYEFTDPTRQLDVCKAANWLDRAVKGQAAHAALWMSYIYHRGYGVQKNTELAYRWFLFWAATLGIAAEDLPLSPGHFGLEEPQVQALQSEMNQWNGLRQPNLDLAPCPGCDAAGDHMCKLAELRKLEEAASEPTNP